MFALNAISQDQTRKMAKAIITIKLMMESPETDIKKVEEKAKETVESQGGEFGKAEIEPVAFGLKALNVIFIADEDKGSELFEEALGKIEEVSNATVVDYRRAIG